MAQKPARGRKFSVRRFFARLQEIRAPSPVLHFGGLSYRTYFGAPVGDATKMRTS
jgi:hypothetical protein